MKKSLQDDERDLYLCSEGFGLAQRKHLVHTFGFKGNVWALQIGVSLSEALGHTGELTV